MTKVFACIFAGPIVSLATVFLIAISLTSVEVPVRVQISATPDATVRRFYEWYLHALNKNQDPLGKHQAELSKFVTHRLMTSLKRGLKRDEIDSDFPIDAQDWDGAWEKNISTSKDTIQGERATVSVTLKGGKAKRLKVGLRKESDAWKIDSVNGHLGP